MSGSTETSTRATCWSTADGSRPSSTGGDLTAGDPATDLAAAWLLFDPSHHDALRSAYGPTPDGTWERAKGWAALFAVMLLDVGITDDRQFEMMGRTTLERLAAD